MRPIDKGDCPQENGEDIVFKRYEDARGALIMRLGQNCSFCEARVTSALAVEHRLPKSVPRYKHLICEWVNFLLGCTNCNATKSDKDIEEDDYFWADKHNTAYLLEYSEGGIVKPRHGLSAEETRKAYNLITLVGLDKIPGNDPKMSDRRWLNRLEAWNTATQRRQQMQTADTPAFRESIANEAKLAGHFSVWMTVFADDTDMLQRIIAKYPGTARECFDSAGRCLTKVERNLCQKSV